VHISSLNHFEPLINFFPLRRAASYNSKNWISLHTRPPKIRTPIPVTPKNKPKSRLRTRPSRSTQPLDEPIEREQQIPQILCEGRGPGHKVVFISEGYFVLSFPLAEELGWDNSFSLPCSLCRTSSFEVRASY